MRGVGCRLVRLLGLGPGGLGGLVRVVLDVVVLDGQAPDVEVIADADNDIDDEAAVHTQRGAEHEEEVGNLVLAVAKGRGPANTNVLGEDRTHRVRDTNHQQGAENVVVRERLLEEVGGNHAADRVGVDETDKDGERDEVVVEDERLKLEVGDDEEPDGKDGAEAEQGTGGVLLAGAAGADNVEGGLDRVEDEDDGALDEVPLGKGQVVDGLGDAHVFGKAESAEHALLPDVSAAEEAGEGVDKDEDEDAFDGAVDDAEGEGLGVVFIPGLDVEGEESCKVSVSSLFLLFRFHSGVFVGAYKQRGQRPSSSPGPCSGRRRR